MFGYNISANELPDWYKVPWMEAVKRSEALTHPNVPYQRFPEHAVAPLNKWHQQAFDLARQTGAQEPYFAQAGEQFGRGSESFPEHYEQYMNPYMEQVVNQLAKMGGRSLEEHVLPQIQAQYVGQGAERSTAHDEQRARAMRDMNEAILREQQKALFQGYGETGKQFQEEKLRQLAAGAKQAELGRYAQAGKMADIEQLIQPAELERNLEQRQQEHKQLEHARQQHFPAAQLQQHVGLMQGVPQTGVSSQTMYQPAPMTPHVNMPGQLGAAAMGLYGASQMGRAHGGAVTSNKTKKPFGISHMKFKSSNKPQKHSKMKYKHPHEGRM